MAEFANPFVGNIQREMTPVELAAALRVDIAGELEAIHLYRAHAAATSDPLVKKVLLDIAGEETEHCGELLALVRYLNPDVAKELAEGEGEVKAMMQELGMPQEKIDATVAPFAPKD